MSSVSNGRDMRAFFFQIDYDLLDGLPPNKMHCSNLAADGLHKAIEDYRSRHPDQ